MSDGDGSHGGRGRLLLVPAPLDFGCAGAGALPSLDEVLPLGVIRQAAGLAHWAVENAKSARAFLKRVDALVPLAQPLQALGIAELPRTPKGGAARAGPAVGDAADRAWSDLLAPALAGHDVGLLSEAGLPAVADPGAQLVQTAHRLGIAVVALAGPSSLLLALAASGLNGQSFAFVGYLPIEADRRAQRIRVLEALSRRERQTQLIIETPYRNPALLGALLAQLRPSTRLSVSCGLTLAGGWTRSDTVAGWGGHRAAALPADVPAVFALLGE